LRRVAAALLAGVIGLTACGDADGGDDVSTTATSTAASPVRPALDQIGPAMAAVEEELGGPQQFFEVNATPQVVNVFVATDGATGVTPFVYVGGELAPAGDPSSAEGATFAADAVTFDPGTILDGLAAELPESDVVLFTILGGPGGAVQYVAGVQSSEGGVLDVTIAADGTVQEVDPGP
jgi:hypothetical protein